MQNATRLDGCSEAREAAAGDDAAALAVRAKARGDAENVTPWVALARIAEDDPAAAAAAERCAALLAAEASAKAAALEAANSEAAAEMLKVRRARRSAGGVCAFLQAGIVRAERDRCVLDVALGKVAREQPGLYEGYREAVAARGLGLVAAGEKKAGETPAVLNAGTGQPEAGNPPAAGKPRGPRRPAFPGGPRGQEARGPRTPVQVRQGGPGLPERNAGGTGQGADFLSVARARAKREGLRLDKAMSLVAREDPGLHARFVEDARRAVSAAAGRGR